MGAHGGSQPHCLDYLKWEDSLPLSTFAGGIHTTRAEPIHKTTAGLTTGQGISYLHLQSPKCHSSLCDQSWISLHPPDL